jgi:hypothetical protein
MFRLDCTLVNIMNALREEPSIQTELMQELLQVEVSIGAKYTSPFREDHNPGCFFQWEYGILTFKDFAADIRLTGNVLNMLELCTGMTKADGLKYINRRYNLGLGYETDMITLPKLTPVITKQKIEHTPAIIRFEFSADYMFYDYFYAYGIQKPTLNRFLVLPCKTVWVKNKRGVVEVFQANKSNPVYLYCWKNAVGELTENYKMLQPFARKNTKWRTNHGLIDDVGLCEVGNENNPLEIDFITSSRKDRMVLYEIGYTSICANNEAQIITSGKYKARYTFMDNDAAGIASAGKYNLPALFVPKEPDVKDPSDYAKKYGLQALKQFIDASINTSKQI